MDGSWVPRLLLLCDTSFRSKCCGGLGTRPLVFFCNSRSIDFVPTRVGPFLYIQSDFADGYDSLDNVFLLRSGNHDVLQTVSSIYRSSLCVLPPDTV